MRRLTLGVALYDSRGWQKPPQASKLIDTPVIYCGDNLDQLRKLPEACVDLVYVEDGSRFGPWHGQTIFEMSKP